MNKTELINKISERTNLSKKDTGAALDVAMAVIGEELKAGNTVQLIGFGTFTVKDRPAREGRNPKTGEAVQIKAMKTPVFRSGKGLKEMVNEHSRSR